MGLTTESTKVKTSRQTISLQLEICIQIVNTSNCKLLFEYCVTYLQVALLPFIETHAFDSYVYSLYSMFSPADVVTLLFLTLILG